MSPPHEGRPLASGLHSENASSHLSKGDLFSGNGPHLSGAETRTFQVRGGSSELGVTSTNSALNPTRFRCVIDDTAKRHFILLQHNGTVPPHGQLKWHVNHKHHRCTYAQTAVVPTAAGRASPGGIQVMNSSAKLTQLGWIILEQRIKCNLGTIWGFIYINAGKETRH